MYDNFLNQRQAIEDDIIDLIYANPHDAVVLVREKGFKPLVKPEGCLDEAIIVVNAKNQVEDVVDLQAGVRIAIILKA